MEEKDTGLGGGVWIKKLHDCACALDPGWVSLLLPPVGREPRALRATRSSLALAWEKGSQRKGQADTDLMGLRGM